MMVKMWISCLHWHRSFYTNALITREWLMAVTAYLYIQWWLWVTNHNRDFQGLFTLLTNQVLLMLAIDLLSLLWLVNSSMKVKKWVTRWGNSIKYLAPFMRYLSQWHNQWGSVNFIDNKYLSHRHNFFLEQAVFLYKISRRIIRLILHQW